MNITITINTGNAAFEDNPHEVSRILSKLADDLRGDPAVNMDGSITLRDINGNKCGFCEVDEQ